MCLFIVCETMFTVGESRAISHASYTEQQAKQVAGNPRRRKSATESPLAIHRHADRRRQPRTSLSTAKATSSTQRPQTCTEAATRYYNYTVNETDEEREDPLPKLQLKSDRESGRSANG